MNTTKRHPFSIDCITGDNGYNSLTADGVSDFPDDTEDSYSSTYSERHIAQQTPSPSDSGMESDSPGKCEMNRNEEDNAIVDVLLTLEKNANKLKYKVTADGNADDKPSHSYIALISMAILSSGDRKLLLCDIYQYIMVNFEYYNNEEKAWRNSIRHNLSLNECFVKAGRADNGKGNYWAIHPACVDDFAKGDFRRRQARRRARKCQKDNPQMDMRSPYRYNVGYVPMTKSHIAYHPYGNSTTPYYYSQQPGLTQSVTNNASPPSSPFTSLSPTSVAHAQPGNVISGNYLPACSMNSEPTTTSPPSSTSISAAAQRFLTEQANNTMYTMQALAQQQFASSLQFQNW